MPHNLYLPAQYAIRGRVGRNRIEQLRQREGLYEVGLESFIVRGQSLPLIRMAGGLATVLVSSTRRIPDSVPQVLCVPHLHGDIAARLVPGVEARWLRPAPAPSDLHTLAGAREYCATVRDSWRDRFVF